MFMFRFLFERGYLLVDLPGAVSGMRRELFLRPCFALFAFAVVEAVRPQHRESESGSRFWSWKQLLGHNVRNEQGSDMHPCVALEQRSRYKGIKGATIPKFHDTTVVLPNMLHCAVPLVTVSASQGMSLTSECCREACGVFQKELTIH